MFIAGLITGLVIGGGCVFCVVVVFAWLICEGLAAFGKGK
jgi:hypothetical protein